MRRISHVALLFVCPLVVTLIGVGCAAENPADDATATDKTETKAKAADKGESKVTGPAPAPVDPFHPEVLAGNPIPEPAYGGRVIIHQASMPESLAYMIENSAYTRRILYEVSETLILQNWETWEHEPVVARSWDTEDQLILKASAAQKYGDQVHQIDYTQVKEP